MFNLYCFHIFLVQAKSNFLISFKNYFYLLISKIHYFINYYFIYFYIKSTLFMMTKLNLKKLK